MKQEEQRDYLIKYLLRESKEYGNIVIPSETEEKKRLLRSLMNIRIAAPFSEEFESIQNDYLREANLEKGIVETESIQQLQPGIAVWKGDITRLKVDAIVNAANSQMLGCFVPMHTCIDNCIHTYAGIQMRAECNRQMNNLRIKYGRNYEQPTAVPMLTPGYNLPAKYVIHVVGPIVDNELTPAQEKELSDCYKNTLDMCAENGLKSVAFCCISTGVFHFPNERAAEIAVATVTKWMNEHEDQIDRVIFNVFKDEDKEYYERLLHF